ncbi:MAG: phosphoglycerate mutase [Acidimicrobiia bacterium]|nr:phosphoglycerate mutase [Acidimicrobiia bacterium]
MRVKTRSNASKIRTERTPAALVLVLRVKTRSNASKIRAERSWDAPLASESVTRLLLIRHAPIDDTGTRLSGRETGHHLGQTGRREATGLADRLADISLTAVYCSPIERAAETAAIIADKSGLEPIIEPGFNEVDMGDWAGRTLKSLQRLKAWQTVQFNPSRFHFPNGEHMVEMQSRGVRACEQIVARHRRNDVVAGVGHADVIKAVLSHYLGQPLDLFQRIIVGTTSVSVIDFPQSGIPVVSAINSNGGGGSWR